MKKTPLVVLCALMLVLAARQARATEIALEVGANAYYVGTIVDGIPANEPNELRFIGNLIALDPGEVDLLTPRSLTDTETYDRRGSILADLPPTTGDIVVRNTSASADADKKTDYISWTSTATGLFYILGKYDGPNGGDLIFLVSAKKGDVIEIPDMFFNPFRHHSYGISHYAVFEAEQPPDGPDTQRVPDGGSTVVLLGCSVAGLAALRRCFAA